MQCLSYGDGDTYVCSKKERVRLGFTRICACKTDFLTSKLGTPRSNLGQQSPNLDQTYFSRLIFLEKASFWGHEPLT